jgi:hypothetical protein
MLPKRLTPLHYVALLFTPISILYFSSQLLSPTANAYNYVTLGGNLSLIPIILILSFESMNNLANKTFGRYVNYMTLFYTYGFFFTIYALYYFSMEFYKDYTSSSPDQQKMVLHFLALLGSLGTFLLLLPRAGIQLVFTVFAIVTLPMALYTNLLKRK